jgi:predicted DNA-binding transcriptional regulator YafY
VDNAWYLLAHDPQRGQLRTFALARIRGPSATGKTFDRPRGFSAEKELKSGFGVFGGSGKHAVKIRFDGFAARLVRERDWHPSQKIRELRGGELELCLGGDRTMDPQLGGARPRAGPQGFSRFDPEKNSGNGQNNLRQISKK